MTCDDCGHEHRISPAFCGKPLGTASHCACRSGPSKPAQQEVVGPGRDEGQDAGLVGTGKDRTGSSRTSTEDG